LAIPHNLVSLSRRDALIKLIADHQHRRGAATGEALDKFHRELAIRRGLRTRLLRVQAELLTKMPVQLIRAGERAAQRAANANLVFALRLLPEHRIKRHQLVNIDRMQLQLLRRPLDRRLRNAAEPLLDRVQHLFLSPIAFEEAPFATNPDLASAAAAVSGDPTPVLSVTLGATDTTPYYAAGTALYAYKNAGLPGVYKAVQNNGWVSVVPVQVLGADGSMRDVIPVMSSPVTFPVAERDGRIQAATSRVQALVERLQQD